MGSTTTRFGNWNFKINFYEACNQTYYLFTNNIDSLENALNTAYASEADPGVFKRSADYGKPVISAFHIAIRLFKWL